MGFLWLCKVLDGVWTDKGFNSWVGKFPLEKEMQLSPVFLPGESHGQRSLACQGVVPFASPWSGKESDTTEMT